MFLQIVDPLVVVLALEVQSVGGELRRQPAGGILDGRRHIHIVDLLFPSHGHQLFVTLVNLRVGQVIAVVGLELLLVDGHERLHIDDAVRMRLLEMLHQLAVGFHCLVGAQPLEAVDAQTVKLKRFDCSEGITHIFVTAFAVVNVNII